MSRAARKRAPAESAAPAGPVLVAIDRVQMLVWIRFDGDEKIAVALDAKEARDLAGAIVRAAGEIETAGRLNGGLAVC